MFRDWPPVLDGRRRDELDPRANDDFFKISESRSDATVTRAAERQ